MSIKVNTAWNFLGTASPMVIGIATMPFLLHKLGVERLGVLTLIWALIGYFSIFDFGLGRALTHKISGLRASQKSQYTASAARSGLMLMAATGALGSVLVLGVLLSIGAHWLNVSPAIYQETFASVLVAAFAIPITTITSGLKGVLEGFESFKAANLLRLCLGSLTFASPVVVIIAFGPDLKLVVIALVLSRLLIMLGHIVAVNRITPLLAKSPIEGAGAQSSLFRFGAWMTVSNIVSPLMVVADRFIISNFLGSAVVAFYTVPSEFLLRLLIIPAALTTTLFPLFTQSIHLDIERTRKLYNKSLRTVLMVMLPICLATASLAHIGLEIWLGVTFAQNASLIAVILCAGIFFNSLAQIPHAVLQAQGNVKGTSLIHVGEFIIYLPLLIISVKAFGIIGAAASWVLRAAADFVVLHRLAQIKIGR